MIGRKVGPSHATSVLWVSRSDEGQRVQLSGEVVVGKIPDYTSVMSALGAPAALVEKAAVNGHRRRRGHATAFPVEVNDGLSDVILASDIQ